MDLWWTAGSFRLGSLTGAARSTTRTGFYGHHRSVMMSNSLKGSIFTRAFDFNPERTLQSVLRFRGLYIGTVISAAEITNLSDNDTNDYGDYGPIPRHEACNDREFTCKDPSSPDTDHASKKPVFSTFKSPAPAGDPIAEAGASWKASVPHWVSLISANIKYKPVSIRPVLSPKQKSGITTIPIRRANT
jgi:hypothetical protein